MRCSTTRPSPSATRSRRSTPPTSSPSDRPAAHRQAPAGSAAGRGWNMRGLAGGARRQRAMGQAALFEVLLVIVLGAVERPGGGDLGHHRLAMAAGGFELRLRRARGLLLGGIEEEDRGAVLGPPVRTLAVELGGVVVVPEGLEQLIVGDPGGIEPNLDGLGM